MSLYFNSGDWCRDIRTSFNVFVSVMKLDKDEITDLKNSVEILCRQNLVNDDHISDLFIYTLTEHLRYWVSAHSRTFELANIWNDVHTLIKFKDDDIKENFFETFKKETFATMVSLYDKFIPDGKDVVRGETCKSDKAAVAQLKRIEDTEKFWRRLKSLLQHKFVITSLKGTAYEFINSDIAEQWLTKASAIYQNKNGEDMDVLNTKVDKLAKILGL